MVVCDKQRYTKCVPCTLIINSRHTKSEFMLLADNICSVIFLRLDIAVSTMVITGLMVLVR